MFTDNILQFAYGNNSFDSIRKNPFLNRKEDYGADESCHSDVSEFVIDNDLLVSDHFDSPFVDSERMLSIEKLTSSVKECKQIILSLVAETESKNKHIEKLIQLNEALHNAKEFRKVTMQSNIDDRLLEIADHKFIKWRCGLTSLRYCEVCQRTIKTACSFYLCDECNVSIHKSTSCIQGLNRGCPAADNGYTSMTQSQIFTRRRFSSLGSSHNIDIDSYPVPGDLTSQRFLCAECNRRLKALSSTDSESSTSTPTRFCHYYRKFYCSNCHWNDKHVIPSVYFVLNKWIEMSVCRSAYIKLRYMWNRALFRMPLFWQETYTHADSVLIIRKKLFFRRVFISNCPILKQTCDRDPDWLVDQPYLVTMQFVKDLCAGSMLERLQALYSDIIAHIPQCEHCQRLCTPCHMCSDPVKLNTLSRNVWTCNECFVTYIHEKCGLGLYNDKSQYVCHICSNRI